MAQQGSGNYKGQQVQGGQKTGVNATKNTSSSNMNKPSVSAPKNAPSGNQFSRNSSRTDNLVKGSDEEDEGL